VMVGQGGRRYNTSPLQGRKGGGKRAGVDKDISRAELGFVGWIWCGMSAAGQHDRLLRTDTPYVKLKLNSKYPHFFVETLQPR